MTSRYVRAVQVPNVAGKNHAQPDDVSIDTHEVEEYTRLDEAIAHEQIRTLVDRIDRGDVENADPFDRFIG